MDSQIVKVSTKDLGQEYLGKSISEIRDHLHDLNKKNGFNICGEGGEYETVVFDCPIFKNYKIDAKKSEPIIKGENTPN